MEALGSLCLVSRGFPGAAQERELVFENFSSRQGSLLVSQLRQRYSEPLKLKTKAATTKHPFQRHLRTSLRARAHTAAVWPAHRTHHALLQP